jgi:hypothetical protein
MENTLTQPCCDVCKCSKEKRDYSAEINVILQSIKQLSGVGEKKVCAMLIT